MHGTGSPPRSCERILRAGRPRKRWRYVGIFGEQIMACAALVQIGPARQSFWAVSLRGGQSLEREHTRLLPRASEVRLSAGRADAGVPGELRIEDRGVRLELALHEQPGIEALCASGRAQVWTRKQAGVRVEGTLAIDGGQAAPVAALAVIDDTCGHHRRVTEWRWSAGVGRSRQGAAVAWNLVSGVNDPEHGSERAVWVEEVAAEAPPVSFAPDLSRLECADGSRLAFSALSERARRERLLLLSSDYRAPFGEFSGSLPGGIELEWGLGVMEHHRARW
jgi:hypothetical protein